MKQLEYQMHWCEKALYTFALKEIINQLPIKQLESHIHDEKRLQDAFFNATVSELQYYTPIT